MKQIYFWKGQHGRHFQGLLGQCLEKKDLLIICPPYLTSIDFFAPLLPFGEWQFIGDWSQRFDYIESQLEYPAEPIVGIFTTGSTRERPKLVLYSEENLQVAVDSLMQLFNPAIEHIFCYPQPFHVFGLVLGYVTSLLTNRPLHFVEGDYTPFHHQAWLELDEKIRSRLLTLGTPTHFKDLLYYLHKKKLSPSPSYASITGGALVEKKLWLRQKNELQIEKPSIGYGCTELTLGVTHLTPGLCPIQDGVIGEFLPHIQAQIDSDGLLVSGPSVCLAMIQENRIEFPHQYKMRDLVEPLADQGYRYLARAQNILNRGGEKFLLDEIESYLSQQLKHELTCLAVKCPRLGEELAVLISHQESQELREQTLKTLKNKYAKNFTAQNIVFVSSLPTNANAKVDRKACRRLLETCQNLTL